MVKTTVNTWLETSMIFLSVEPSSMEGRSIAMITQFNKMKNKTTLSNHCLPTKLMAPMRALEMKWRFVIGVAEVLCQVAKYAGKELFMRL